MRRRPGGADAAGPEVAQATVPAVRPRGSFGVLCDRVYGPFWAGKLLSTAGIWVHNVVAAIITYQLTRSTFLVGAVTVAQFLPQLLFAPLSGAQADRGNPRRQLVLGRLIAAAGSGGLALALAVLGLEGLPGAWPVIVSAGVVGIGFVVGGPAMHSLLPTLVPREELSTAVALSHLPPMIARSGGPILGAFLLVASGPAVAFAFAAAGNLVFATIIWWLPIGRDRVRTARKDSTVRGGLRYLRTAPTVSFTLLAVLALGFAADPVVTLTPALSDAFGRGEELVGAFASAFGIGAAAVFPLLTPLRRRAGLLRLGVGGLGCMATGMAVAGMALAPSLAIVGLAIAGAGFAFSVTGLTTQLYTHIPDALRGRIMALWSVAFLGSRPVAAAINGAVADATSVRLSFLLTAGIVAAIAAVSAVGVTRSRDAVPARPDTQRRC